MKKVTGKRVSILVECCDGAPNNAERDGSVCADDTGCNGVMHKIEHNGGMPDNRNEDDNVEYVEEASALHMKKFGFAVEPFYAPVHIERQSFHAPKNAK
jgi:hypothetical protein